MKDFTTSAYIDPAIIEIKKKYQIKSDSIYKVYFNCDLLLKKNIGNECIVIEHNKDLFIPNLDSIQTIFNAIEAYTEAAETSPGELGIWNYREKTRVYNAIRDRLIEGQYEK